MATYGGGGERKGENGRKREKRNQGSDLSRKQGKSSVRSKTLPSLNWTVTLS